MKVKRLEQTIDVSTGEVLYSAESNMDFYLYNPKGFLLFNNKPAVRLFQGADWKKLSADEKSKIMTLIPYIDAHNRLMQKGKPMTAKDLSQLLEISEPRAYSFLKSLKTKHMIRKSEKILYVSPNYMLSGSRLSRDLYLVFQDQLDPVLPDWVKGKFNDGE